PGLSVCSVKQKHWILVKYCPAWLGVTLNVAVPVTAWSERLRAVNRAILRAPIATLRWVSTGSNRQGREELWLASKRIEIIWPASPGAWSVAARRGVPAKPVTWQNLR